MPQENQRAKNIKIFDEWNEVKKITNSNNNYRSFKTRDIFYMKMGQNIGYEQNGKGKDFVRPILVYKKFTKDTFIGIPLTSTIRNGSFFYGFTFIPNKISTAILVQSRLFSSKRLLNKIGKINEDDFKKLKEKYLKLLG